MATPYKPIYIRAPKEGLIQSRPDFIYPEDAYPVLENVVVLREELRRKQGLRRLGRLCRNDIDVSGNSLTGSSINLISALSLEASAQIVPGSIDISGVIDGTTYTDPAADGVLVATGGTGTGGSINYTTGVLTITAGAGQALTGTFAYYTCLPVMGIRTQETNSSSLTNTIFFDTKYAYRYSSGFEELPSTTPTTWSGSSANLFWTENYWVDGSTPPNKIFWATNFSGNSGDPIRYYNTVTWTDFTPTINAGGDVVAQCLAIVAFRGRLLFFNTLEGPNLAGSTAYYQRIRWSAIGSPFTANAWRDDINGQGGYLDIPTSENITGVGFVRDNLVVETQKSTWQLRYTGRSISPFQIEKINSELGSYSPFSNVAFDTSLIYIGDKGITECDSYSATRIDIKIPDLVFNFSNVSNNPQRIQGIRDIQQKLCYWNYVYNPADSEEAGQGAVSNFPNRRLVYNYENKSWAIFDDSFTALGTYQPEDSVTWDDADWTWDEADWPWQGYPTSFPSIMGGNQQGYVMFLGSNLTPRSNNDSSLYISAITGQDSDPTIVTCPNHNLVSGKVIKITGIPTGNDFDNLNDEIFGVTVTGTDTFYLYLYDSETGGFTTPQTDSSAKTYIGGGEIAIREGFTIKTKKFNALDLGENIRVGFIDTLTDSTENGEFSVDVYINYNEDEPVNIPPQNSDSFFNSVIPTSQGDLGGIAGNKYWHRTYLQAVGSFISFKFYLSNAQLVSDAQEEDFNMAALIIWARNSGRLQSY